MSEINSNSSNELLRSNIFRKSAKDPVNPKNEYKKEMFISGQIKISEIQGGEISDGKEQISLETNIISIGKRISRIGVKDIFIDLNADSAVSKERISYWIYSLKEAGIINVYIIDSRIDYQNLQHWEVAGGDEYIAKICNIETFFKNYEKQNYSIGKMNGNSGRKSSKIGVQIGFHNLLTNMKNLTVLVKFLKTFKFHSLIYEINDSIFKEKRIDILPKIVESTKNLVDRIYISFGNIEILDRRCIDNMVKCKTDKYIFDFTQGLHFNEENIAKYKDLKPIVKSFSSVKRMLSVNGNN